MIYIRDLNKQHIMGYVGNNIFQLATAISLAIENKTEVIVPDDWQYRNYFPETGVLKYAPESSFKIAEEYTEPGFHYTPIPYVNGMNLNGYFQSYKYFDSIRWTLREDYFPLLAKKFAPGAEKFIPSIFQDKKEDKIIAIHVRRGDYLKFANSHPIQTMDYYNSAIAYFKKLYPKCKFLVFSNDIPECKKMFIGSEFVFCESEQEKTENNSATFIDFTLMTSCDGFIICNSSFSWWAAYLNDYDTKKVVAPSKWFGPALAGHNTADLYCPGWIKI